MIVPGALFDIMRHCQILDELFEFFIYTMEVWQKYHIKHPLFTEDFFDNPEAWNLAFYIPIQYQKAGTVKTEFLENRINTALKSNNVTFFEFLLKSELPQVGIDIQQPQAALDTLALFFQHRNRDTEQMIQAFLARMRMHYPDEVDNFLDEQQASEEFQLRVRTNEPNETVGELLGSKFSYFLRDEVILGAPDLRAQFMRMLAKAADCKNAKEWLYYLFCEIVNLVYGEEILRR